MENGDDSSPLALFKALREAFGETIRARRRSSDLVKELSVQAFDCFDGNVAIQIEDMPALACHQGCAACCDLRVAATAPEILLIAQYIVANRLCLIYRARPLACRSHASFDKAACAEAMVGLDNGALVSMPHFLVRCVVQNALLASLRDAGLAWGLYELNSALSLALGSPGAEAAWRAGGDPLPNALVADADAR